MDVEAEIRDLKRRVGELEGSFGFLTEQVRHVHRDLLDFEARTDRRFDAIDKRFDGVDARFVRVEAGIDKLDRKIDGVDSKIDGLVTALPGIIGDALREYGRKL